MDERCTVRGLPGRGDIAAAGPRFPGTTEREVHREVHRALSAEVGAVCTMHPVVSIHRTAFREAALLRDLLDGAIVTAPIYLIPVVVARPSAHALAELRFWSREAVSSLVPSSLPIPVHAIALLPHLAPAERGLAETHAAPVIPRTISALDPA